MIDLHTHTTHSDGSLSPAELAEAAVAVGLSAVALTDHDTTSGLAEFMQAAGGRLRAVPGVEISTDYWPGTVHMLGYFIEPGGPAEAMLVALREGREERNMAVVQRLNDLGCPLTLEEVAAQAGGRVIARPHFAQAMVARGFVRDREEAFARYLGRGMPAYVRRRKFSPEESVRLIRGAGGVPVLAHPFSINLQTRRLRHLLAGWREAGLEGIEAWYPAHPPSRTASYLKLAGEFDLVATGGSDFHGTAKPDIRLGVGFGSLRVPDDVVDRLAARRPQGRS